MKELAMSALTFTLFGSPTLSRDGVPLRLRSRKCIALLAYLAVTGASHSRSELEALFWPESDAPSAQNVLRVTLSLLRRAMGEAWLAVDRGTIGLDGRHRSAVDVIRFRDLLAQCQTHDHPASTACPSCLRLLVEAVELCQGDFMAGFTLRDSPQFDDWQALETRALQEELAGALEQLVEGCSAQGDVERAIAYAKRWVALDPLHEPAHRSLMHLFARSDQQAAALRQYETCARVLQEQLGVSPSRKTTDLYQDIRERRSPESQRSPQPPPTAPAPPPHNLPPQPTPFVGREEELAQIAQLLGDPTCRLLTVVGPGGIGKTRLAIRSAEDQVQRFAHGVHFVPLAPLGSPQLLASTILETLSIPRHGGTTPHDQLLNYLRDREVLLVLDNFEHLLEGTMLVAEMLEKAPRLTLLMTSRERLNLRGEWLLELWGLESPGDEEMARAQEAGSPSVGEGAVPEVSLEDYSAIQLFSQCARRVQRDFSLETTGPACVARICRLVEGMPLAIELFAPWIRLMDCEAIARELEGSLSFMVTSLRDVPPRHRSMRAVFDHSWKLLSSEERRVLRKLSVFRGGFRREAAAAVAGASLSHLAALVDKSWLRSTPSGRYEMHELIRQYGAEKLAAVGLEPEPLDEDHADADRVRDLHSRYYGAFLQEREERLHGSGQDEPLREIVEDTGNVWAAWRWALERGDTETIGKCVGALAFAGEIRRWNHEVAQALEDAAAVLRRKLDPPACSQARPGRGEVALVLADTLSKQSHLCANLGQPERAVNLGEESLALLDEVAPGPHRDHVSLYARLMLAYPLVTRGDMARAQQLLREALPLAQRVGTPWQRVVAFFWLGHHAGHTGHHSEAEGFLQESIAVANETGERWTKAHSLNRLSKVVVAQGDYPRARMLAEESLQIFQELGDQVGIGYGFARLGEIATALEQYALADQHFQKILAIDYEIGGPVMQLEVLNGQGTLALAQGQHTRAKEHLGEAVAIARATGHTGFKLRAMIGLGQASLALGEDQRAKECFCGALVGAMKAGRRHTAVSAVLGIANLLASEGDPQRAVEFLTMVLHHPAATQVTKDKAQELLSRLGSELPPEALGAATARGQSGHTTCERELEEVTAEVLRACRE